MASTWLQKVNPILTKFQYPLPNSPLVTSAAVHKLRARCTEPSVTRTQVSGRTSWNVGNMVVRVRQRCWSRQLSLNKFLQTGGKCEKPCGEVKISYLRQARNHPLALCFVIFVEICWLCQLSNELYSVHAYKPMTKKSRKCIIFSLGIQNS